ncbi:MAG: DUF2142 domain-containing protein [Acutalibacteraceae bacterium]
MEKKQQVLRTALRAAAVVIAATVSAFCMEIVQLRTQPIAYEYDLQGEIVSFSPTADMAFFGCSVENGRLIPNSKDPNCIMDTAQAGELTSVQLLLSEPLDASGNIQLFYAAQPGAFSESDSQTVMVAPGQTKVSFSVPTGAYAQLRMDINVEAAVGAVACSAQPFVKTAIVESVHVGRVVWVALVLAVLFGLLTAARVGRRAVRKLHDLCTAIAADPKSALIQVGLFVGSALALLLLLRLILPKLGVMFDWPVKVWAVTAAAVFGLMVACRRTMGRKPEVLFLVMSLAAGSLFAVFMPSALTNSWDEVYHYKNALNVSYVDEVRYTAVDYYQMQHRDPYEYDMDALAAQHEAQDEEYRQGAVTVNEAPFKIQNIWAIPSALGLFLARALGLPYYMMLIFGRWGNLIAYSLVGFLAVRRLKSGKMILAAVLLAPTNLFMASAFSYDPWVTVWAALGLSCFFREWQEPNAPLRWQNAALMIASLTIACPPKAIYFPLLCVLFFLPKSKFSDKRARYAYYTVIALAMLLLLWSFAAPFFSDMSSRSDMRGGSDVNAGEQVAFILGHPFAYIKLLLKFLMQYLNPADASKYLVNLAYHGMAPHGAAYIALLAVAAFTDKSACDRCLQNKWGLRAAVYGTLFVTIALAATSLYVSFTSVASNTVAGMQPRYILPILFPALLLLGSSRVQNRMNRSWYNGLLFGVIGMVVFSGILYNCVALYELA